MGDVPQTGTEERNLSIEEDIERDQDLTIEEAFGQIRELLTQMESDDITLERSFDNYEKGMKLIRMCNEKIDAVEKKVQMMNADGTVQDFT